MTTRADAPRPSASPEDGRPRAEDPAANVEKIRDIIFGGQMRDYDRRFARLEERVEAAVAELRSETGRRLEALEHHLREEITSLAAGLREERDQRGELGRQLAALAESLAHRAGELDARIQEGDRALRQQLHEHGTTLSAEMREKAAALQGALARETDALRADTVDRATLAELLTEVALRLRGEFALPDPD